ncbi:MAG: membrane protein insertion efficiency factor YidD [Saprospiraceae bacterium]
MLRQIINWIFILPIKFYQWVISPMFPPSCRFQPTCSHYAVDAIREWGPIKGIYLAIRRVSRCHPWSEGGEDPVPRNPKKKVRG